MIAEDKKMRGLKREIIIIFFICNTMECDSGKLYANEKVFSDQELMVLKILKPSRDVLTRTPGACGCHLISLTCFCPW